MKKVSFDYDGTLSRKDVQEYAKSLIEKGVEIQITTAREEYNPWKYNYLNDWNKDLYLITDMLGIARENIKFCSNKNKSDFISEEFLFHLDDDEIELMNLVDSERSIGVDVTKSNWIKECHYKLY